MGPKILHFSDLSGDTYADGDVLMRIHRQNSKQGQYYVPGVGFNAHMGTEMCSGPFIKLELPLVKEN